MNVCNDVLMTRTTGKIRKNGIRVAHPAVRTFLLLLQPYAKNKKLHQWRTS